LIGMSHVHNTTISHFFDISPRCIKIKNQKIKDVEFGWLWRSTTM
jgi:hypothetical protein